MTDRKNQTIQLPEGFTRTKAAAPRRLILGICGGEKSGKTHFALTAPQPIVFFNFDKSSEDIMSYFPDADIFEKYYMPTYLDKTIYANAKKNTDMRAELLAAEKERYVKVVTEFEADFYYCLFSKDYRTLFVDTDTNLWQYLQMAEFGKDMQNNKFAYGPLNAKMAELIRYCKSSDKNVIFSGRIGKQYEDDVWRGEYERRGWKDMPFEVQGNILLEWDGEAREFSGLIQNSSHNPLVCGTKLITKIDSADPFDDMCTFPWAAATITNTAPEEWK